MGLTVTKGIIVPPLEGESGIYTVMSALGEDLFSFVCPQMGLAKHCAESLKPDEVDDLIFLRDSGISREELFARNETWVRCNDGFNAKGIAREW